MRFFFYWNSNKCQQIYKKMLKFQYSSCTEKKKCWNDVWLQLSWKNIYQFRSWYCGTWITKFVPYFIRKILKQKLNIKNYIIREKKIDPNSFYKIEIANSWTNVLSREIEMDGYIIQKKSSKKFSSVNLDFDGWKTASSIFPLGW